MRSNATRFAWLPFASALACYSPQKEDGLATSATTASDESSSSTTTLTTSDATLTGAEVTSSTHGESESESSATTMPAESSSSSGEAPAVCGDGMRAEGEDCDDGNTDPGDLCDGDCHFETLTFAYTGASEMLEVPAWVDTLRIEAFGAQGGGGFCCDTEMEQDDGGLGGYAAGTYPTLAGLTLAINVGGAGISQGAGGWNGGGLGGEYGAGGGGASDVRLGDELATRIIVGGGGGGGNCGCPDHGTGGGGGGLAGEDGISLNGFPAPGGGTQAMGGAPGDQASAGTVGQGGSGMADAYHVAGGGGGWYGGGGGYATGAGGGSSYYGAATDPETMAAAQAGDGQIIITATASL